MKKKVLIILLTVLFGFAFIFIPNFINDWIKGENMADNTKTQVCAIIKQNHSPPRLNPRPQNNGSFLLNCQE
jgi:hypothetical protein